jgi:hypothetical protein
MEWERAEQQYQVRLRMTLSIEDATRLEIVVVMGISKLEPACTSFRWFTPTYPSQLKRAAW